MKRQEIDNYIKASFYEMDMAHKLRDSKNKSSRLINITLALASATLGIAFLWPPIALAAISVAAFVSLEKIDVLKKLHNSKIDKRISDLLAILEEKTKEYGHEIEKDYALKFSQIQAVTVDDFFVLESYKIKPSFIPILSRFGENNLTRHLANDMRLMNEDIEIEQGKLYKAYKSTNDKNKSTPGVITVSLNSHTHQTHSLHLTPQDVDKIFSNPEFNFENFIFTNPESLAVMLVESGHQLNPENKAILFNCFTSSYESHQECKSFLTYYAQQKLNTEQMKMLFELIFNPKVFTELSAFLNLLTSLGAAHNKEVFLSIREYAKIVNPNIYEVYTNELNKAVFHLKNSHPKTRIIDSATYTEKVQTTSQKALPPKIQSASRPPLEQTMFELKEFLTSLSPMSSLTSKEKEILSVYTPRVDDLSKSLSFLLMHKTRLGHGEQVDLNIITSSQIPSLIEQWEGSHNTSVSFEIKKNLALSFASIQDFLTEKTMEVEKQLLDKSLVEKVYTQSKYLKTSK